MFRALLDWRRYFEGASQENPRGISPRNIWNSASTVGEQNKAGCQEKPLCQCEALTRELSRIKKRMNSDSFVLRLAYISVSMLCIGSNNIRTKTDTGGQGE